MKITYIKGIVNNTKKIYKTYRIIDGKSKWIIVDEYGIVINRNPSKFELAELIEEVKYYRQKYTDKQLLGYLIKFYRENERPPTAEDFINNVRYPSYSTYVFRFGSWSNALKKVRLDIESMIKNGIVETTQQKGRLAEIIIRDHFSNPSIDLAGKNKQSPCDGICPKNKTYDVKSSGIRAERYYLFSVRNKYKEEIEIYYLLGFNKDYTELMYAWRIPGEIIENDYFQIGLTLGSIFNVENMKEYIITEQIREVLNKYSYFERIRNYRKIKEKDPLIYE